MKKLFLIFLIFFGSLNSRATLFLGVVGQPAPPLLNMCPGDTVRFAGDSLNQNVYGTVSGTIQNADSNLTAFFSVSSFTNLATTYDHILVAGDVGYAFTPLILGYGLFSFNCLSSNGSDAFKRDSFEFFPDPVSDKIKIKSGESQIDLIIIYDNLGRKRIERHASSREEIIDVSELGKGIYFLQIRLSSGLKISRFVKWKHYSESNQCVRNVCNPFYGLQHFMQDEPGKYLGHFAG